MLKKLIKVFEFILSGQSYRHKAHFSLKFFWCLNFCPDKGEDHSFIYNPHFKYTFISLSYFISFLFYSIFQVSTVYIMGDVKIPAAFLVLVSAVALSISLSGLSFPFSAVNKCPKRAIIQVNLKGHERMNSLHFFSNIFLFPTVTQNS